MKRQRAAFIVRRNTVLKRSLSDSFTRAFKRFSPHSDIDIVPYTPEDAAALVTKELSREGTDIALIDLGANIDITALIARGDILRLNDHLPAHVRSGLLPAAYAMNAVHGGYYGLQKNIALGMLFCRRDILDRYGFDIPASWDELIMQAAEIVAHEKKPIIGFRLRGKGDIAKNFAEYLWSNGGSIFDGNGAAVASAAAEETVDLFQRLLHKHKLMQAGHITRPPVRAIEDFRDGNVLFYQGVSDMLYWMHATNVPQVSARVKFSLAPRGPSGRAGNGFPQGSFFAVPARTRCREDAAALLRFFTDYRASGVFDRSCFHPFTRYALGFEEINAHYPWYVKRGYQLLQGCRWPEHDVPLPLTIQAIIEKHVVDCIVRLTPPAPMLRRMADEIDAAADQRRFSAAVTKGLSFMRSEFRSPITVTDIAKQSGATRSHFSRMFARSVGASPVKHLQGLRIAEAKRLLGSTTLPIDAVAVQAGFMNRKYFYRLFKQIVGATPSVFRKRHRSG